MLLFGIVGGPPSAPAAQTLRLPTPLAAHEPLIERYWTWVKAEIGAPDDLPLPKVVVEDLPRGTSMGFFFPAAGGPDVEMRVVISTHSLNRAVRGEDLEVLSELAHELSHYVLLLAENGWDPERPWFRNEVHHHCDPTFMHLTAEIGAIIWSAYHSNNLLRSVDHMVRLSCWREGHRIGASANR